MFGASWLAIVLATIAAAVAALLAGCVEDASAPYYDSSEGGSPDDGCPDVKRCDVRERACQRSVMEAVACLRGGGSGDLPSVRVISEAELIERVSSDEEDPEEVDFYFDFALWSRGLSLFGLAPEEYELDDAIADTAAQVAAVYFNLEREIAIIDRGESLAEAGAVELFAHEVVHALQDQEHDLGAFQERWSTSFDASLALAALIEGEAVHYQILAAVDLAGRNADDLDWSALYGDWQTETLRIADEDDAPVALADVRFPYAFGGHFVTSRLRRHGRAGIDALFETPPRTSSEVLFGSSASELAAEREALSEHAVPALGDAFDEYTTALGAWIARMYATRADAEDSNADRALAADAFSVLHDSESDTLVAAWRARTLANASADIWPRPAGPVLVHELDSSGRETYSIASDPEQPELVEMLAWRPPFVLPSQGSDAAASTASWTGLGRGHYRACAYSRPALPTR